MFETVYGVFVGTITFCLWSLFTKGGAEDIASYYGKKLLRFLNLKSMLLEKKVEKSITQIDNVLLDLPLEVVQKIDAIVNNNKQDILFQQLLDQNYKLSTLLEKYYEQLTITENEVHN